MLLNFNIDTLSGMRREHSSLVVLLFNQIDKGPPPFLIRSHNLGKLIIVEYSWSQLADFLSQWAKVNLYVIVSKKGVL